MKKSEIQGRGDGFRCGSVIPLIQLVHGVFKELSECRIFLAKFEKLLVQTLDLLGCNRQVGVESELCQTIQTDAGFMLQNSSGTFRNVGIRVSTGTYFQETALDPGFHLTL